MPSLHIAGVADGQCGFCHDCSGDEGHFDGLLVPSQPKSERMDALNLRMRIMDIMEKDLRQCLLKETPFAQEFLGDSQGQGLTRNDQLTFYTASGSDSDQSSMGAPSENKLLSSAASLGLAARRGGRLFIEK